MISNRQPRCSDYYYVDEAMPRSSHVLVTMSWTGEKDRSPPGSSTYRHTGKDSGVIDPDKWCTWCERDGHENADCPSEYPF